MLGAIIGDIMGSSYEFRPCKHKNFPLLTEASRYTDDTVMTLAVARAFLDILENKKTPQRMLKREKGQGNLDLEQITLSKFESATHRTLLKGQIYEEVLGGPDQKNSLEGKIPEETLGGTDQEINTALAKRMREFGQRHPQAGYGGGFRKWLASPEAGPYHSFGNGSAMRVSSVAWLYQDLALVKRAARLSAAVTHNHPEGIKGAEAIACCIYLARNQASKADIKQYVSKTYGYNLDRSLAGIRPDYTFDVSCQGSVPEAIIAFLEGQDFEDCIRNAVSLGGDADTQAAMAGSIAEAFFGLPENFKEIIYDYLPEDLTAVISQFQARLAAN